MEHTQRLGVVVPEKGEGGLDGLKRRIRAGEFAKTLTRERVLLFRGFDVRGAADFGRTALAVVPEFKEQHYSASPPESKTRHVFSAAEPSFFYPIMQHYRETSFLPQAPRRNLFYGKDAPPIAAETPVTDFPSVAQSLNPKIRRVFETSRIRNIRHYFGPQSPRNFGLWSLKRRDQIFKTPGKSKTEAECRRHGLRFEWMTNDRLQWGDVIAIDNFSIAHGRWPYSGSREILVAWWGTNTA